MGCTISSIDEDERVQMCKERKRLMKELLGFRAEFAGAIMAYLKALKNTGMTLRQFTETEPSELENIPFSLGLLPSAPPPLRPSPPPPPPPYSPDSRKLPKNQNAQGDREEIIGIDEDGSSIPLLSPKAPIPSSPCESFPLFQSSSARHELEHAIVEDTEEENWVETRSQFEEEDQEHVSSKSSKDLPINLLNTDIVDDDSTRISGQIKDDMAMVEWRSEKTLPGIVKQLDDYFLQTSASAKEIALMVDMGANLHHDLRAGKGKRNNSARVLSSLSWSWSSAGSMHLTSDTRDDAGPFEPCKPGAHCITLEKLYAEEQTLYKAVKEEGMTKLELERKSLSLKKQENDNADPNKIEKTQSAVESLQSDILRLQEIVRRTCSCVLAVIDEELHPQLVALLSGLIHMWKTMCKCHIAQSRICQQVKYLVSHHNTKPTTEDHHEATVQLENEVNFWYNSFFRLIKCQKQYVSALCRWIQRADCVVGGENQNHSLSTVRSLCEKWQQALDRLPDQVVLETMKSFLLVIGSILMQQKKEGQLKKKSDKSDRRLHKELNSLIEIETKLKDVGTPVDTETELSPKHPLSIKRTKAAALRKRYEGERSEYLSSIQVSRAMTLNDLHAHLPRLFQALMGFSSACVEAFEIALSHVA